MKYRVKPGRRIVDRAGHVLARGGDEIEIEEADLIGQRGRVVPLPGTYTDRQMRPAAQQPSEQPPATPEEESDE